MPPFNFTKVPGLDYTLEVRTTNAGRWYTTPQGKCYPSASSVTGILSREAIAKWRAKVGAEEADRKTKAGADRGTLIHFLAERYLLNTLTPDDRMGLLPYHKELFLQIKRELDRHIAEVFCVEQSLYSDRLRLAGRCDAIVIWDGVLCVLDFKTAAYVKPEAWVLNYYVQTSAYAEMFEERTALPINHVVLLTAIEGQSFPTISMKKKDEYLPILGECIATYYMEQGEV